MRGSGLGAGEIPGTSCDYHRRRELHPAAVHAVSTTPSTGGLGETVFSAGLGGYRLDTDTEIVPKSMQATKLGYYIGVGEWFTLSRRWRLVGEVAMHRSENEGTPTIVTATAGVAFQF